MSDLPDFVIDGRGADDRRGRMRIWRRPEEALCSQLICSAAIERAVRLVTGRGVPADLEHWRDSRETWQAEQGRQRA
jgi:hypothetical protein